MIETQWKALVWKVASCDIKLTKDYLFLLSNSLIVIQITLHHNRYGKRMVKIPSRLRPAAPCPGLKRKLVTCHWKDCPSLWWCWLTKHSTHWDMFLHSSHSNFLFMGVDVTKLMSSKLSLSSTPLLSYISLTWRFFLSDLV